MSLYSFIPRELQYDCKNIKNYQIKQEIRVFILNFPCNSLQIQKMPLKGMFL
jgi:hypothetical protein